MALDYTTKYASQIAERFKIASITNTAAGHEYDFTAGKAVKIYSMNTAPLTDYERNGARYGKITDVEFDTQEMICTQEKSFIKHLEKLDNADISIDATAGKFLRMQQDEVITPVMDKYRLQKWTDGAGISKTVTAPTKNTITGQILTLKGDMVDKLVPDTNITCFVRTDVYVLLKQADVIVGLNGGDYARKAVEKGVVGTFDGMKVIPVPTTWLPDGVFFMLKAKGTTVDPVKLAQYDVIPKTAGYSGPIVQGLAYYDSFVLEHKKDGIAVAKAS